MAEEKAKMKFVTKKDVSEKMENWKSEWMVWWRNLKLGDRKHQKTSRGRGYEFHKLGMGICPPTSFFGHGKVGRFTQ